MNKKLIIDIPSDGILRETGRIPSKDVIVIQDGKSIVCHSTGQEMTINGKWMEEFIDDDDKYHYL